MYGWTAIDDGPDGCTMAFTVSGDTIYGTKGGHGDVEGVIDLSRSHS